MKTYKRITARQAIIEECAKELAHAFPGGSEKTYRQNINGRIEDLVSTSYGRSHYYTRLSSIGKTRLFNAIAHAAYVASRSAVPPKLAGLKPYKIVENDVTRWR